MNLVDKNNELYTSEPRFHQLVDMAAGHRPGIVDN